MNISQAAEIQKLGGDPADDVWRWLILRGPHGSSFTWSQTRGNPPGYVGVEHLQRIIEEEKKIDPTFVDRAIQAADQALSSTDPDFLCRAIQVAAVVGASTELRRISTLTSHENSSVANHAKAAVFYLKMRLRTAGALRH